MIKKSVIERLYLYNIHIGHLGFYNSKLNYYFLGKRFNYIIIDMNKTFILLKKALCFVKNLSLKNGSILFNYSQYLNLNLIYKCILLSIAKHSNQQLITHNWVYSSIGNFFFSFYDFIKELAYIWVFKNRYLFKYEKNSYYSYVSEEKQYYFFEYLFLSSLKDKNNFKVYRLYQNWYDKWIKKQNSYDIWVSKKSTLKYNNFLKQVSFYDLNNIFKKRKFLNFKSFF